VRRDHEDVCPLSREVMFQLLDTIERQLLVDFVEKVGFDFHRRKVRV
jgi:hypothetical protein